MRMHFRFEATENGNSLWGEADDGFKITASVVVPEGASNDYGYLTLKHSIMAELDFRKIDMEEISFQYDGQEQYLNKDASADTEVLIDITD